MAEIEKAVLNHLNEKGVIEDSTKFGAGGQQLVGVLKSLGSADMVTLEQTDRKEWTLGAEAMEILEAGSPEARVWALLPIRTDELDAKVGAQVSKVGQGKLGAKKLITREKDAENPKLQTLGKVEGAVFEDTIRAALGQIAKSESKDEKTIATLVGKDIEDLKKRKLVQLVKVVAYKVTKGPKFALERQKQATDLTREMLLDGSWENADFKDYKLAGAEPDHGSLHPLMKMRQEFRELFLEMGFQEMDTQRWVESSFWCFDTLFVPQQHPARDSQDTFFISDPELTEAEDAKKVKPEYLKVVKNVHENGDYGSVGYNCKFSNFETSRNVLRTHTTACSSRTLYNLAQLPKFKPGKYFSIDRVFRNEEMDKTHLCEFHQIEGFIVDYNLSLSNMMSVLGDFFTRIGTPKLRFKPTYNPYTEPSMEIFGWHEGLGKYIEVGNSGLFRPEMLRPMGFPENVSAIAWGLSLERPAMMHHKLRNIHDLFGAGVKLDFIKNAPITRI
eukprot:TRINITY_DN19532_c0_g1_i1.p1 TRINITY_DN19532_c0_g1~~TRINITY_DN19532_c0_g1_i1.p1  ORF type:complete len:501 (+),score=62.46 TRINITY_DN19532_c0_g1_i1:40-1542(+)